MLRTRSIWLPALLLTTTLVAVAPAARAENPATPGAPSGSPKASRLQESLGLSDDQMTQIRQLHAQQAAKGKPVWQQLRQARTELRQLALTGADPNALQAKQAEVTQLMAQTVQMRVETLQAIAPILTPEQRAKFAQMSPRDFGHRGGPRAQHHRLGS